MNPIRSGFASRAGVLLTLAALLTVATACTGTGTAPPVRADAGSADTLRVMSFNIRYGTARDGENAWPARRSLAIDVIRDFAPTVLGVQEALRFQLDEIGDALPGYTEIGVGREDGIEAGEYSAIVFDHERLELLEHDTFWLSDTPDVPNSMSWGNRITRIATTARFRDRTDGRAFMVFNTHWDHESQPSRERSAALILERIRARADTTEPVILMGDFNAGEDNAAFRALVAQDADVPLYDTFRAVHPDARETGTYHAFGGDRSGDRIDAILASPHWRTISADIVLTARDGRHPSDHFPVTALLVRQR